jgi:hypothetical protein
MKTLKMFCTSKQVGVNWLNHNCLNHDCMTDFGPKQLVNKKNFISLNQVKTGLTSFEQLSKKLTTGQIVEQLTFVFTCNM